MRFLPDSSVMVAALSGWHVHHPAAVRELERRLSAGDEMVVAGHSLAETYAVLTRLPSPHRLSVADATQLIAANFLENSSLVALSAEGYRGLLEDARGLGIAGGQTYDLVIALTARQADVSRVLTFNIHHFRHFTEFDVIAPS